MGEHQPDGTGIERRVRSAARRGSDALPRALVVAALIPVLGCGTLGGEPRDEHGMTALMRAAKRGDSVEVARLIERGANVRAVVPTRDGRELLAFISFMQQLPSSDIGFTPLHYAVQGGDPAVARLLLDGGADVHHAARGGTTPLDLALHADDRQMMELLIESGARPGPRQLAVAVGRSPVETVRFLLANGADPNVLIVAGRDSQTILISAVRRGDPAIVRTLLEAGASIGVRDRNGWTAYRWARRGAAAPRAGPGAREIVAMLERAGATDPAGIMADALFDAMLRADANRVRELLRAGADPNARDERGVPPLVHAAQRGQTEIVAELIAAGADVNVSPEHDTTPLIAAVTGGSIDVVRQLIAAGARVDQPDHLRLTPLEVASSWNRTEITALLLEASATPDPRALANAALTGNAEQVRLLLARGLDPNANGGHALSEATRGCLRHDNREVIALLVEAGANPRITGDFGPLNRAAALCDTSVVRLLLAHGADPNARAINGYTPLASAAGAGRLDVVRLLIAARADVNARDDDGKSVLDYAAAHPEVVAALRSAGAR